MSEISQVRKDKYCTIPREAPNGVIFIETEGRRVGAEVGGGGVSVQWGQRLSSAR